jgi:hypothetical protein
MSGVPAVIQVRARCIGSALDGLARRFVTDVLCERCGSVIDNGRAGIVWMAPDGAELHVFDKQCGRIWEHSHDVHDWYWDELVYWLNSFAIEPEASPL